MPVSVSPKKKHQVERITLITLIRVLRKGASQRNPPYFAEIICINSCAPYFPNTLVQCEEIYGPDRSPQKPYLDQARNSHRNPL